MSIESLWENASPTSTFSSQTINLDLSNYDSWGIFANITININRGNLFIAPIDHGIHINFGYGNASKITNYYRAITYDAETKKITLHEGWESTPSSDATNNSVSIPIIIYGIKGGYNNG